MEGITFSKKFGILDLVLSGQKTMFRLVSKKKDNKPFYNTAYKVGDEIAILQTYKDIGLNPEYICMEKDEDGHLVKVFAKDSAGWNRITGVDPHLMPHLIQITDVKTEHLQDISDTDCRLEGIVPVEIESLQILDGNMPFEGYSLDGKTWAGDTPQDVFKNISNAAVKKDAWKDNKYVDCYEFKLIHKLIH